MKSIKLSLILATALITLSGAANAADGKALYADKACGSCHGADGNSPMIPAYPKLAGQSKEYTTQQLKDFKSGARANGQSATMTGILANVSDEESAAIAEYLSGL